MKLEVPRYAVQDEVRVDPARTALVVIDMQNDFVKPGGSLLVPDAEATIPAISSVLDLARASRMPVVYSQDTHRPGDPEWEIWPEHCREGPGVQAMIEHWRRDIKSDLAAIKAWESGLWQTIDARPLLTKIQCPTLVLVGALDLICGPAQGRLIVDAVPGAELVSVLDCGHFIAAEAPESFRDEIIKFAGAG